MGRLLEPTPKPIKLIKTHRPDDDSQNTNHLLKELMELEEGANKEGPTIKKTQTRQPLATLAQRLNKISSKTSSLFQSNNTGTPTVVPRAQPPAATPIITNSTKLIFRKSGPPNPKKKRL